MSYLGLAFTFLAVTCEVIGLSQPVVAVVCWIEEVYVADEHLEVEITHKHTAHENPTSQFAARQLLNCMLQALKIASFISCCNPPSNHTHSSSTFDTLTRKLSLHQQ